MSERSIHVHVVPVRTYFLIFATLLVMTALTTAAAFVDLGPLGNVVAMAIASFKATLVVLFFMHVRYSTKLTGLVVTAGLFWLLILVALTLADYFTRGWLGVPGR